MRDVKQPDRNSRFLHSRSRPVNWQRKHGADLAVYDDDAGFAEAAGMNAKPISPEADFLAVLQVSERMIFVVGLVLTLTALTSQAVEPLELHSSPRQFVVVAPGAFALIATVLTTIGSSTADVVARIVAIIGAARPRGDDVRATGPAELFFAWERLFGGFPEMIPKESGARIEIKLVPRIARRLIILSGSGSGKNAQREHCKADCAQHDDLPINAAAGNETQRITNHLCTDMKNPRCVRPGAFSHIKLSVKRLSGVVH